MSSEHTGGRDGQFRPRPARQRARRHRPRRTPAAARRRSARTSGQLGCLAGLGGRRCRQRVRRPGRDGAVVASSARGDTGTAGPARGGQHRHRVRQVAGLSAADHVRAGHRPARSGAVSVTDQGARARSVARSGVTDRGGRPISPTSRRRPTTATAPPRCAGSRASSRGGCSPTPT